MTEASSPAPPSWRAWLHEIIFEADTPAGRAFDVALIACILTSVAVVMLESVATVAARHGPALRAIEWGFTIIFTIEYVLRLAAVRDPGRYVRSFYGVIDLVAVAPTYLSLLLPGSQYFLVVRILRLLRVFRVLKLAHYVGEANQLARALRASRRKITVFLVTVLTLVIILGALMYLIEGPAHGFTSIPISIYWAVVTLTTVGYGDLAPATTAGRLLSIIVMILGYGIIAVPTGIVTVELASAAAGELSTQACPACGRGGHDADARFCKHCGAGM